MSTHHDAVRRAERHELTAGGRRRRFLLVRPAAATGPVPLVVDVHPSSLGPAAQLRGTGFAALADDGVAVAALEGLLRYNGGFAWSVPGMPLAGESGVREEARDIDDVAFLGALLDALDGMLDIDPRRRHLSGFSGGARLVAHAAARFGERLASVACVAGIRWPQGATADPAAPMPPLLAVHGLRDDTNPYQGGAGPRWDEPVPDAVARWATAAGCSGAPARSEPAPGVTEFRYRDAAGREPVRLVTVADLGHAWPGSPDPLLGDHAGRPSSAYHASDGIRQFFQLAHRV